MSAPKAAGKKAVSPSKKGEAARAEKKNEPRVVDFRGLQIALPPKLPLSLALKWRKIRKESGGDDMDASLALFELIIGEDQWEAVAAKCDAEGLTLEDDVEVLGALIDEITGVLGTGPGE